MSAEPSTGLELAPFRALRYNPDRVGDLGLVTSPPYDVIDEAAHTALEERSPYNAVRLILPRDTGSAASRYAAAAATLQEWRHEHVLELAPRPALYVYEERGGDHVQRGLVGALRLVPLDAGVVLPHENTMAGPVADRLALTEATGANLEPIFLVYDGGGAASAAVAAAGESAPLAACADPEGLAHRLWEVADGAVLDDIRADLQNRRAMIADGHHRYATYLQHQAERRAAGAGPGPWDYGLALLVDSSAFGPRVHAIHRVVSGLSLAAAAGRAEGGFAVRRLEETAASEALHTLAQAGKSGPAFLLSDGREYVLLAEPRAEVLDEVLPAERSAAWRQLDVTVAHHMLIRALWGLSDDEQTVGYQHDVDSALAAARDGGAVALLLNPTPLDSVVAVAAAGERMPRKSTLFTPKPASGLLMRVFADQD